MRHYITAGILVVAFGFGVPTAMAQNEQSQQQEAAQDEDPNDRICRRVRITGSNIARRYCMTRAEWSELSQETREEASEEVRADRDRGHINREAILGSD